MTYKWIHKNTSLYLYWHLLYFYINWHVSCHDKTVLFVGYFKIVIFVLSDEAVFSYVSKAFANYCPPFVLDLRCNSMFFDLPGIFRQLAFNLLWSLKTAVMEHKRSTIRNGEVAIDFPGEGNYSQRPAPHSPTLGHVHWNSFNIENETPHQPVSYSTFNF